MTKSIKPESENLSETITIRISPADLAELSVVTDEHPHAKKGAIARECFRRGLKEMFEADTKKKEKG